MINPLIAMILLPIVLGMITFMLPKKVRILPEALAFIGAVILLGLSVLSLFNDNMHWQMNDLSILNCDFLSKIILLACGFFGLILLFYAIRTIQNSQRQFYGTCLVTLGAAAGTVLSSHLMLLLIFWGILAVTLYLLILTGNDKAPAAARKSLILVGGSDALMLLGIGLIFILTKSFSMEDNTILLSGFWPHVAFICLLVGIMAKTGAMPMHTWIPDTAESAPIVATAFLPAALDKLIGIYLLVRFSLSIFKFSAGANLFLMILGAVTILGGVMMALVQHDMKRLLAYHAVSQVGYMILGIGTGTIIGIAGGFFHMLNNTLYKSCLFLVGGAVEKRTGTTDLHHLGNLANAMPLTFAAFLISAFAISGIPPLNGFASKWMVYQGLIALGKSGDSLWMIWLLAAMFGSGLTLASFMKLTHSVFLGSPSQNILNRKIREVDGFMLTPMLILSILCLISGIFVYNLPVQNILNPIFGEIEWIGIWSSGWASVLLIIGAGMGLVFYFIGNFKRIREVDHFVGGENIPVEERITGTHFYDTIKELKILSFLYKKAEEKVFDIYDICRQWTINTASRLQKAHTGFLSLYVAWILGGAVILFLILSGI